LKFAHPGLPTMVNVSLPPELAEAVGVNE
jgi:hypothetical protein